jgi:hypothetical protein
MSHLSKCLILLFFVLLIIPSLSLAKPANAQSIPKPSVPEFSVRYVEHPFDLAPTFQRDPYSGKNTTIQEGHRIQNRSIELIIRNQPFTSSKDSNGNKIELFYNISSKGHFGTTWYFYPTWMRTLPVTASNNEYTILSFGLDVNYENDNQHGFWYGDLSNGDQVDFRIQALIGHYSHPSYNIALEYNSFTGKASDWSSPQTIKVEAASESSTPSPTPTVPEFSWLVFVPLLLSVFSIAAILKRRKQLIKVNNRIFEAYLHWRKSLIRLLCLNSPMGVQLIA